MLLLFFFSSGSKRCRSRLSVEAHNIVWYLHGKCEETDRVDANFWYRHNHYAFHKILKLVRVCGMQKRFKVLFRCFSLAF